MIENAGELLFCGPPQWAKFPEGCALGYTFSVLLLYEIAVSSKNCT